MFFAHLLFLQDAMEEECGIEPKRFNVLPVNTIMRHSIPYGNAELHYDVKSVVYEGEVWRHNGQRVTTTVFNKHLKLGWWKKVFDIERYEDDRYELNDGLGLRTNGVDANLYLRAITHDVEYGPGKGYSEYQ